ncbi:HdeD family acid-resistance protein [Acrocarpospora sp. B8E8]|uniref:HdeD family acid-resistance protein n=1 Tax=Acrocarpospora sp. B8E8 TaxID=3153572 RepID=UPI00325EB038
MANRNTDIHSGAKGTEMAPERWWTLAVRGVLAIIFGLIALIWPAITLKALVIVFGVYALINGATTILGAFRDRPSGERGWLILSGLVSLAAGIAVLVWPRITALALIWLIGAWFLITGIVEIVGAVMRRKEVEGDWSMLLNGVLAALFGLILMLWPGAGAIALVALIAIFAIVLGAAMLVLAFRARNVTHHPGHRAHPMAA